MPVSSLATIALGPFVGIVDTKNPSVPMEGKLRNAKNLVFTGGNKLSVMNGSALALTLKDDAGSPATITSVLHVGPFMDGAIAVGYSSATQKVYLYRLPATMDGWYTSAGALTSNATPQPCAVLWTSVSTAPDVSVAEGLGTLYVAQTSAIDVAGLYFRTQQVVFSAAGVPTVSDVKASGSAGAIGADNAYFTAICSFHQHLWGVGYGIGAVAGYTSFRPEMARFSQPSFGDFQTADSIVIGDRVRSVRERIIAMAVAGNALFLAGAKSLFRVTGYGRDSWVVETLDSKYGIAGPKAFVAVGPWLYYWTSRGPSRCADSGSPEPLWDGVVGAVATVANESRVVVGFDAATDRVLFTYDAGSGVRVLCAFDTRREDFVSVDGDVGLVINCAGAVEPIYQSTATPPSAPAAPTIVSTSSITTTTALCTWTVGDALATHEISYREQGGAVYIVGPLPAAGVTTQTLTGLTAGIAYEWRIRALKNGIYSSYVGPVAASQFTTTSGGGGGIPPAAPTGLSAVQPTPPTYDVTVSWTYADASVVTQIHRGTDGVSYSQVGSVAAGVQTYNDYTFAYGTFYYKVRHVAADGTLGAFSTYAARTVAP